MLSITIYLLIVFNVMGGWSDLNFSTEEITRWIGRCIWKEVDASIEEITNWLNNGLDINVLDAHGDSLLEWATECNNHTLIKILLDNGAHIDPDETK